MSYEVTAEDVRRVRAIAGTLWLRVPPSLDFEDLVSEGLLALMRVSARFDPSRGLQPWTLFDYRVRGAMRDLILARRKIDYRYGIDLADVPEVRAMAWPPMDGTIEAEQRVAELRRAFRYLSRRQKLVLRRRFRDGREVAEIARELSLSETRVRQIQRAALDRLRGVVTRYRASSRAALIAALEVCDGNKSAAARHLGISRDSFNWHYKTRVCAPLSGAA